MVSLVFPKQPDLNYHNPKVLEEVGDIMHTKPTTGVAGFRCDVSYPV